MKKMKRYNGEEDSLVEFETKTGKNEGASIDEGVRERAMKFISEGGKKDEAPAPKAAPKASAPKTAPKFEPKAMMKADMNDMPENLRAPGYKAPSVVKTVSKEVTKPTPRSPVQMLREESEYTIKPRLQSKGESLMKMFGMKKGGAVKSASARADGCAIRGKTRA
jgi:hypothetical protein